MSDAKSPSRSSSPMPSNDQPSTQTVDQATSDLHSFYDLPPVETVSNPSPETSPQSLKQSPSDTQSESHLEHETSQSTNQSSDAEVIKTIMSKFAEYHTDLSSSPHRRLIKEGKIMRQATFKTVERQVYLFNDCFLITEPISSSSKQAANNAEKLVQKQLLDLRGVLVEDPDQPSDQAIKSKKYPPNSFIIMTPQRDFVFITANPSIKQDWIKAIRDASSQYKLTHADGSLDQLIDGSRVFGANHQSISQSDDRLLSATLHSAVAAGTDDILLHLLSERGEDPNVRNPEGTTALHIAISHMNAFAVSLLIAHGADVSMQDRQGNTPLHLACQHADFGTVMVLVSKGADVKMEDGQGKTPLWVLCEHMQTPAASKGHSSSQSSHQSGKQSQQDYLKACTDMVRFMLDAGAKLDDVYQGEQLFHHMALAGYYEAVYALVNNGASISHADANGRTILHHMCEQEQPTDSDKCDRQLKIIQFLLASGCPPNVRDAQGNTPLHLTRSLAIAGCLIVNGARADLKNEASVKASTWFDTKSNFANESEWLSAAEALRDAREGWTARPETVMEEDGELNDGSMLESVNAQIHQCMLCHAAFSTLTRRKHLCEHCGTPVCSDCSTKQFTADDAKKHRACDVCYNVMCELAAAEARRRREEKRKAAAAARAESEALRAKRAPEIEKAEDAARRADFEAREARIAEIEARTHRNKEAFEERKSRDRAREQAEKLNDLKGQMGSNRQMLDERGQKLNEMGDKSSDLAERAEKFADMAKKIKEKEKSKSSWFGF